MFCYWEETFVPIPELLLNPDSSAFPLDKPVICVEEDSTLLPTTSDESSEWLCDSNIILTCFRCSWITFVSDLYLVPVGSRILSHISMDLKEWIQLSSTVRPHFSTEAFCFRFRNHASLRLWQLCDVSLLAVCTCYSIEWWLHTEGLDKRLI